MSSKETNKFPGYPTIEYIVETEDFSQLKGSMAENYAALEKLKKEAKGLKKQAGIKKALKAFDLTMDLIRHLLEVKKDLVEQKRKENVGARFPRPSKMA